MNPPEPSPRALDPLYAAFSYFIFVVLIAFWLPLMAVVFACTFAFDRNRRITGRLFRIFAPVAMSLCPLWRVRMHDVLPREQRKGPYVVVANHLSFVDILVLSTLPWEMKWMAKDALFKVPWLGWMMKLAGDIPIVRGDAESASAALTKARGYLERGMSVMIFPEGTRSRTGEMKPFKTGAFRLAIETGCPVLPIALHGTAHAMPAGSPWIRRARAEGRVLRPVPVTGLTPENVGALAERVFAEIDTARSALARQPS